MVFFLEKNKKTNRKVHKAHKAHKNLCQPHTGVCLFVVGVVVQEIRSWCQSLILLVISESFDHLLASFILHLFLKAALLLLYPTWLFWM